MQTPAPERAIVVFGSTWDKETERFPSFVYDELEHAVRLLRRGLAEHIILCGSHPITDGRGVPLSEKRQAFRMRRYILDRYGHLPAIAKGGVVLLEDKSTSIPDHWVRLRQWFPTLKQILLVTLQPLLPRVRLFGETVYNDDAEITFIALAATSTRFPEEKRLLEESRCTLEMFGISPGKSELLIGLDDQSLWPSMCQYHHETCPHHRHLHQAVAAQ